MLYRNVCRVYAVTRHEQIAREQLIRRRCAELATDVLAALDRQGERVSPAEQAFGGGDVAILKLALDARRRDGFAVENDRFGGGMIDPFGCKQLAEKPRVSTRTCAESEIFAAHDRTRMQTVTQIVTDECFRRHIAYRRKILAYYKIGAAFTEKRSAVGVADEPPAAFFDPVECESTDGRVTILRRKRAAYIKKPPMPEMHAVEISDGIHGSDRRI